jgi:microcompartment protein CcmL/EutN
MDALALLELDSIARGWRVLDAMVKESPITVVEANLVEPGKFLILFGGGVAEVQEAHTKGLEIGRDAVIDQVLLPHAHPRTWACLRGAETFHDVDCAAIVEGRSIARTILSADAAVKAAEVQLCALRVTPALGGRAYYVLTGAQSDVEAAVDAGLERLGAQVYRAEVVPNAHPEFLAMALRRAPFSPAGAH